MDKSVILIIVVFVALAIAVLYILSKKSTLTNSTTSTTGTRSTTTSSSMSVTVSTVSTTTTQPVSNVQTYSSGSNNQLVLQMPSSDFVIAVYPSTSSQISSVDLALTASVSTTSNPISVPASPPGQTFDAYVSVTGKVDNTAVEIVPLTTITEPTVLINSYDIPDYLGYAYIIINSSAPFAVKLSVPSD